MKIAVLDDYQDVARRLGDWASLPAAHELVAFTDHTKDVDELARRLAPFDVIVAMRERTPIPAALIDRLPNLRLIVTTGLRNPSIDIAHATAKGIVCSGAPAGSPSTAELAFALVLGLRRGVFAAIDGMRSSGWQGPRLGQDLAGSTLGILGLGNLGSRVAAYARPFGVNLIAWSRSLTPERAEKAGAMAVSFEELLERSDVLTIHLRLTAETRGLIGANELRRMKPGAALVNTSRGPIVDTHALVAALQSGHLGAAALDVFDEEPLPKDDPLRNVPNLYLTPHIGYVTEPNFKEFYDNIVGAIAGFMRGEPVRVVTQ